MPEMHRYNLMLPEKLHEEVQDLADEENVSFLEKIKNLIKIGMTVNKLLKSPDAKLIIREEGKEEREVKLIF